MAHVRGGTALLAGHRGRRTARSPSTSADDHPGVGDPAYRARRNEIAAAALAWKPGDAGAARRLHRGRAGGLAHRLPRAAPQARAARDPRVHRGASRRSTCPTDGVPEPRPGQRAPRAADRLPLRPRRRAGAAARVLRLAARAACSTRRSTSATRRCRSTRPSRTSSTRSSATGTCWRRRRSPSCTASTGEATHRLSDEENLRFLSTRLLVLRRVRRRRRGRRAARLRRRDPVLLRRDRRVPRHGAPPARPRRDGHRRLRHHALPAGPLPGRVDGRGARGGRRLLRAPAPTNRSRRCAAVARRPCASCHDQARHLVSGGRRDERRLS